MSGDTMGEPARQAALATSVAALRRMAGYVLPSALDRRLLDLGERKESLTAEEREELLALVGFTQQRSLERAEAEAALRRLRTAFPELAASA